jgi:hypothetical protein
LFFEISLIMVNVVFYSMEMKFIMCRNLVLNLGEIGPVEVELGVSTVLALGYVYGSSFYQ